MGPATLAKATPEAWRKALAELPERKQPGEKIPAFFFAHGHPGVLFPMGPRPGLGKMQGPGGGLHQFLKDFGPALLEKYHPKAIVVFSAHWETTGARVVTDYGNDQPLLYDYYGFPDHFYAAEWHSNGSTPLSDRICSLFASAGLFSRKTTVLESRGEDGKRGPAPGLDHGVFIPFKLMFPQGNNGTFPIPVVQVSIDSSLDPWDEVKIGKAVAQLRSEGVLILSGGLTIHTFRDTSAWHQDTASDSVKAFEAAIVAAAEVPEPQARLQALADLTKLPGFRTAHPRSEHFVPIYIAAGAGGDGGSQVISDIFGCKTIAFGL